MMTVDGSTNGCHWSWLDQRTGPFILTRVDERVRRQWPSFLCIFLQQPISTLLCTLQYPLGCSDSRLYSTHSDRMRKALQLAALAAGGLASPNNYRGGSGWNEPPANWHEAQGHGSPDWRDHGLASATFANASTVAATSTSASSSENTVYQTVDVTVTSSSCSNTTTASQVSTTYVSSTSTGEVAATTAAASSGSSNASVAISTSALPALSSASSAPSSSVTVDAITAAVSSSSSSVEAATSSSVTPYASLNLPTYSSNTASTPASSASSAAGSSATTIASSDSADATSSSELISHTISAVTAVVPTPITTTVSSSATTCSLLPTSPITNEQQVGDSLLGTLCAPYLPIWLDQYPSAPWGNLTVKNSDATVKGDIPITNVTRYYDFTITRGQISADGVLRDVMLINNQFPGPLIEANWGDMVQVIVHNNISNPVEGTSLHWHGQLQKNTPWEDGTPGASQCPIAPGHSFTYNFQAELHGTSWYHSHYSAQFTAGVAGPLVVHGPSALPYDIDVGPVMLSDWYHIPYFSIVEDAVGTNESLIPPTSDSVLINGRGRFNCSDGSYAQGQGWLSSTVKSNITWTCVDEAPISSFRFQSGKTHRIRLINHGANGVQKFSIDHHNMTIIATDFVPTVPYTVDHVTLGIGQRTDVLVTALDTPKAAIWMRTTDGGGEVCGGSANPVALAAIYYEDADVTAYPKSDSAPSFNTSDCQNDALTLTTPEYAIKPSTNSWTQDLSLTLELNATGIFEFMINGIAFHSDFNVPLLSQVASGNLTTAPSWNVYNFEQNTSIILNITNNMPLTHPFHLHGHNFFVLDVGEGDGPTQATSAGANGGPGFESGATWNGTVVNPENPMRRDGILVPSYGYAAIQFELDNPGLWPFHCHVAWHLSGGQALNIIYKWEDIPTLPSDIVGQTCVDWDYYTSNNVVDQIDSGA